MAISPTFQRYLPATKNVVYDIVVHEPTKSAMRTAEACRVSGDRVAKAVVLRDEYGYVLAILPASHHIRLDDLRLQLGLDVDLAAEYEIEELFDDCVPAPFLQLANATALIPLSMTASKGSRRSISRAETTRRSFT